VSSVRVLAPQHNNVHEAPRLCNTDFRRRDKGKLHTKVTLSPTEETSAPTGWYFYSCGPCSPFGRYGEG